MCAVVQKMVQSESSGVMFTVDPVGDNEKIIIEAGFGLGETIVSGSITPDNYIVCEKNFEILEKKINKQEFMLVRENNKNVEIKLGENKAKQQKLSDEKIVELAKIGKKIESHYKKPMDIEWGLEDNILYIVQARPITTLAKKNLENDEKKDSVAKISDEKILLKGLPASPGIISGIARIVPTIEDIVKINKGDLLVTKMTSPSWVPIMKKASGIITDEGGVTCHAAIVSRELGIPCVVGTEKATRTIKDGSEVTIDGYTGRIFLGKVGIEYEEEKISVFKDEEIDDIERQLKKFTKSEELPVLTETRINKLNKSFGKKEFSKMGDDEKKKEIEELLKIFEDISVKVKVNVALPSAAEKAAKTGAKGVGLLRAEHMITSSGKHPAEFIRQGKNVELKNIVKEGIMVVAEKFDGPVWFRTFDARTDEFRELEGGEKELTEENPMLGWHGIRRDIEKPEMFKAQLLAIKELRQSGVKNVWIMLPFVQSVEEVLKAKEIMKEVGLQEDIPIGVMIETPASVWIIDDLLPHIDFVSFGTNDLTQLTLGMDRNNEKVQKNFTEMHPAILKQIEHVIKRCKKSGITTSICGQAASNPEMVKKLVWMGIDSVSANIDAVEKIRKMVMIEEKKKLFEMVNKKKRGQIFLQKLILK